MKVGPKVIRYPHSVYREEFVSRVRLAAEAGALVLDAQQRLSGALAIDIAGDRIRGLGAIVNPDKLTHLGPLADLGSLLRSAR